MQVSPVNDNLYHLCHHFRQFLSNLCFSSFPFGDRAARIYGDLRTRLSVKGTIIGPNDLMIAAIAIANTSILVTHNITEFQRVDGLEIIDWEVS